MRILVIEDEGQLADLLKRGLAEEGYAVDTAGSGEEGEDLAESLPYDLVILDIILSGKDGVAVCGDLREKKMMKSLIFWWDPQHWALAREALIKGGRRDLIGRSPHALVPPPGSAEERRAAADSPRSPGPRRGPRPRGRDRR